jgi:hypothetical protein
MGGRVNRNKLRSTGGPSELLSTEDVNVKPSHRLLTMNTLLLSECTKVASVFFVGRQKSDVALASVMREERFNTPH